MAISKKVTLTVNGYTCSLSSPLQFYKGDAIHLAFSVDEYGIVVTNGVKRKELMPIVPLSAFLIVETPSNVDSIESVGVIDDEIHFHLDGKYTNFVGVSRMQIILTDEDCCRITLPEFTFEVKENIAEDTDLRLSTAVVTDIDKQSLKTEDGSLIKTGKTLVNGEQPITSKYIKDLPLKRVLDGSESLLVHDLNGTQQAPLGTIVDEIKQNSQEKIREIESELAQTNAQLSQEIDVERKRIDNFNTLQEGSTTGDAELTDIRIGYNGETYPNAGTAVREQIKQVASKFEQSINQLHLDNLTADYEINPKTGELRSAPGWRATDFMPLQPNDYIFVYKENGKYIYGASCFWAVYDSNKQYITGSVTDAAGVDFINATDARVAYIRASFGNARLAAEPMIVPKSAFSKLKDYLPPFKGVLLKDSPYITNTDLSPLQTQLDAMTDSVQYIKNQFTVSTNVLLLDNLTSDYEINPATGELRTANGWRATDFMPLQPNNYIFVYKDNGAYIYGASCFWAVYDSNKQYITGSVTDAAGVDFINATDARVAYIRASFFKSRLQAEPMIVPKTYYSELEDYLPPFKGVLLKDSPYLTECNSAFETDIRKRRIVAPKNVAVVMGNQLDVHYDNILLGADARLMPYKNYYGSAPGVHMRDMFRIDSLQSTITTKASIRILNDGFVDYEQPLGDLMLHKDLYIVPVSKTAGAGMTRNVMFIGDSITANGLYPKEVANLFANDVMNVNLIGTVNIGGVPHEGHGGWTSKDFCETTSFNDYTNAFYNPATKTFDFTYYMNTNGFESVDDVFINLGINDMAKNLGLENIIRYYNKMINSIRAYNPKIRIFIGLCILPYSGKYSTVHNYTQFWKSQRLALHERLIEEYDERESEGIYVVPFNLTIDTEHDFKFVEKPLSRRNDAVKVKYCTDVVHPSTVAYNKMADMAYWYIKYNL